MYPRKTLLSELLILFIIKICLSCCEARKYPCIMELTKNELNGYSKVRKKHLQDSIVLYDVNSPPIILKKKEYLMYTKEDSSWLIVKCLPSEGYSLYWGKGDSIIEHLHVLAMVH